MGIRESVRRTGRETKKDEVTNNGPEEDSCPFCFSPNTEVIMINYDMGHGLIRCKDCFKRMRIGDYRKWQLALKVKKDRGL